MEVVDQKVVRIPNHIGILMDGNRKWASAKDMSIKEGHSCGAENLKRVCVECKNMGINYLTTYAFSVENWKRSEEEVSNLLNVIEDLLLSIEFYKSNNIKVKVIGARQNLSDKLLYAIQKVEAETNECNGITLSIAVNYGGMEEIVDAFNLILDDISNGKNIAEIDEKVLENYLQSKGLPELDVIIRTSGVKRLSRFLLFKSSYAEIIFIDKYWPDFNSEDLWACMSEYKKRVCEQGR